MNANSRKHNFIDKNYSESNSANNDDSNNKIIGNKRWKRKKRRKKSNINYKNIKYDNNSEADSLHSEPERTNIQKNVHVDKEENNKIFNTDRSVMNDEDSSKNSDKTYFYNETLYDVAEMDPWKDDRCRDFIALNVIQRLRSYHLPRNVTEIPPFAPINALRARNLIILPRVLPDYRPCMGELPTWETNTDLKANSSEAGIPKNDNVNFTNLENEFTQNDMKSSSSCSSENVKKENVLTDGIGHANAEGYDKVELQPPPPLLPCSEFSTLTTRPETTSIINKSVCAIERARVLFYGANGPLMTSTSPVMSSGNKMTASSLSRSTQLSSLSRSYHPSERLVNTPKHDVAPLNNEKMVIQSTPETEINKKDDENRKSTEPSVVVNEHESVSEQSKTEPVATINENTISKLENKIDNREISSSMIYKVKEEEDAKEEELEEELNLERKNEETGTAGESTQIENNFKNNENSSDSATITQSDKIDGEDLTFTQAVNETNDELVLTTPYKAKEDVDEMLTQISCGATELKKTPKRISSMHEVETAEAPTPLFCTPMPVTPKHGDYNEQNCKVMMSSNNNNTEIKEFEQKEFVTNKNDNNNNSNETSPFPRMQKNATYEHNTTKTTFTHINEHDNVEWDSCAACDVLIDYFQSLLTRGVVLDRFSHKDLGFAWWVLGKDMNTESLPQVSLSRSPSSPLSVQASRRSTSNSNTVSISAKREYSPTSQTHCAPSFPVGREKLLIMHRNLYYTLLTNESVRAKQVEQKHSTTLNKTTKNKSNEELMEVNTTKLTNNKERLNMNIDEQKTNLVEMKRNNNNLQNEKTKLSRQTREKAKKQNLQALKKMQRTAKRSRNIVEEITVESSISSSSSSFSEEEEEEEEQEKQNQVYVDEKQQEQQSQQLEEDGEKQSKLLLSKRQAHKHKTKNAKLDVIQNKKIRDIKREQQEDDSFLTAVEFSDENICVDNKEKELVKESELASKHKRLQESTLVFEAEETDSNINKSDEMKEEFEVDNVNNMEEQQIENVQNEEIHEDEIETDLKHVNNQIKRWKRRRSSWFDKSRRVNSSDAVKQRRRREKANAVATDQSSHDKSETFHGIKPTSTMEKLEVMQLKVKKEQQEEQQEQLQQDATKEEKTLQSRKQQKQQEEPENELEEEQYRETEGLTSKRSKVLSEATKKRATRHSDEANIKNHARTETSRPSSSPSTSYTTEGAIDSTDISPYEAWLNKHLTRPTILNFIKQLNISRGEKMYRSEIKHNISSNRNTEHTSHERRNVKENNTSTMSFPTEHEYTQQLESKVEKVESDVDHYSIVDKEQKANLVNENELVKYSIAHRINKRLHNLSTPYSFLLASECQNRKRSDFLSLLCASAENTQEDISIPSEKEEEETTHDMQHNVDSNSVDKGMDLELLHSMKRYQQWEAEHLLMEETTEHDAIEIINNISSKCNDDISTPEAGKHSDLDNNNTPVEENVGDDALYIDAKIEDHLPFSQLPFAQKCLLIWHCSNRLDTYARRRAERDAEWKEAHHKRGVRTRGMILRSHSSRAEKFDVTMEHDNSPSSHKEQKSNIPIDEIDEMLSSAENEMPDELILESSLDEEDDEDEELEEEEEEEQAEGNDPVQIEQKHHTKTSGKRVTNKKNDYEEEPFVAMKTSLINPSQQSFADVVIKSANSVASTTLLQGRQYFDYWTDVDEEEKGQVKI